MAADQASRWPRLRRRHRGVPAGIGIDWTEAGRHRGRRRGGRGEGRNRRSAALSNVIKQVVSAVFSPKKKPVSISFPAVTLAVIPPLTEVKVSNTLSETR